MQTTSYRSLFWPMLLIGVGLIWFLGNMNVIQNFNPVALLSLWPLLLIALGVDLLVGRKSPWVGLLIGLLTIGAAVAILLAAPALVPAGAFTSERFTEPLGEARSAAVRIETASQPVNLHALTDSSDLVDARLDHTGTILFQASGTAEKQVTLRHDGGPNEWFGLSSGLLNPRWDIGLSPRLPLALEVHGASGSLKLELAGLQLSSLKLDGGSGSLDVTLPVGEKAYTVDYQGASGSLSMGLPANTDLSVRLDGGSGSLTLSLPANAPVRIEVNDNGSGSFNAPAWAARLSGKNNEDKGVWESSGYASAAHKILIVVSDVGSGSITIR